MLASSASRHTAKRLGEIVGGKDKQQFILRTTAFVHALNRFTVILPFIPQLFFQLGDVTAGRSYLFVYFPDLLVQETDNLFTGKNLFGEQV